MRERERESVRSATTNGTQGLGSRSDPYLIPFSHELLYRYSGWSPITVNCFIVRRRPSA